MRYTNEQLQGMLEGIEAETLLAGDVKVHFVLRDAVDARAALAEIEKALRGYYRTGGPAACTIVEHVGRILHVHGLQGMGRTWVEKPRELSDEAKAQQVAEAEAERKGWASWLTDGVVHSAPRVDAENFGSHNFDCGHSCAFDCGCYMGSYSSGGPVDPRGPCPNNPWKTAKTPAEKPAEGGEVKP